MAVRLVSTDERDAWLDLHKGASARLNSAAWAARAAVERITHSDCDAFDEIARAREALDDAERHAKAAQFYKGKVAEAVAEVIAGDTHAA